MTRYALFLFLLFFLPFASAANRIGVTPAYESHIYTGQDAIEGTYVVNPDDGKNIHTYARGDFAEYVTFNEGQTSIRQRMDAPTPVDFRIDLPEDIRPGEYRALLYNEQYLEPEELIETTATGYALAAIVYLVQIRVPNDGPFAELSIEITPQNIELGDVVYFDVSVLNFGTDTLYDLAPTLSVLDPQDEIVANPVLKDIDELAPGRTALLKSFWRTDGFSSGVYLASVELPYAGTRMATAERGILLGDVYIEITGFEAELDGPIAKLHTDVLSHWNEPLTGVYADLVISQDGVEVARVRSSSIELESWGAGRLTAFWEKQDLPAGEYDIAIYVYYRDRLSQKDVLVTLPVRIEQPAPQRTQTLLIVSIGLLGLLMLLNIIWLMKSKKRR